MPYGRHMITAKKDIDESKSMNYSLLKELLSIKDEIISMGKLRNQLDDYREELDKMKNDCEVLKKCNLLLTDQLVGKKKYIDHSEREKYEPSDKSQEEYEVVEVVPNELRNEKQNKTSSLWEIFADKKALSKLSSKLQKLISKNNPGIIHTGQVGNTFSPLRNRFHIFQKS